MQELNVAQSKRLVLVPVQIHRLLESFYTRKAKVLIYSGIYRKSGVEYATQLAASL